MYQPRVYNGINIDDDNNTTDNRTGDENVYNNGLEVFIEFSIQNSNKFINSQIYKVTQKIHKVGPFFLRSSTELLKD